MADRKISDLTALTTPASGDFLPIVDISEAAAASKNKRITIEELMRGVPDGTAAAPGIAFETDPNTGIYRPGADQLAVSTGGTGRLFVDATGNVGIGGPPGQALQLTRSAASAFIQITDGTINSYFGVSNAASAVVIDVASNTPFRISTNNTERLRITSAGLVGIGTSAIQAGHTLQVNGIIASVTPFGAFTALQTAGGTGFRWTLANDGTCRLQKTTDGFAASTSTAIVIDSSDRVGIGTSAPASLLHLADAGNITVGTTTGTKIGTATTQKLGFYNATPVVQPAAVANATDAASVITRLNDLLARLRTLGIIAT